MKFKGGILELRVGLRAKTEPSCSSKLPNSENHPVILTQGACGFSKCLMM